MKKGRSVTQTQNWPKKPQHYSIAVFCATYNSPIDEFSGSETAKKSVGPFTQTQNRKKKVFASSFLLGEFTHYVRAKSNS